MKAQLLLAMGVLVVLCTACAGAAAAPGAAPALVPIPTLEATPDPLWVSLCTELRENVRVCVVDSWRFEARLLTGSVVSTKFYWVGTDPVRIHTAEATERVREGPIGEYGIFVFDSTTDLTKYARVTIHIEVESREFEFGFPIEACPPP